MTMPGIKAKCKQLVRKTLMLNAGKIKAFRIGRSYRIPKVNVIRFLQNETPEDCNTVNATIDSVE